MRLEVIKVLSVLNGDGCVEIKVMYNPYIPLLSLYVMEDHRGIRFLVYWKENMFKLNYPFILTVLITFGNLVRGSRWLCSQSLHANFRP